LKDSRDREDLRSPKNFTENLKKPLRKGKRRVRI
jgi:hypothetical protein